MIAETHSIQTSSTDTESDGMELYITNSAPWWDDNGHIGVRFYGWTPDGEQEYVEVEGLRPEMYIATPDFEKHEQYIRQHSKVVGHDGGHESLFGESLHRLQFRSTGPRNEVAERFNKTYEADIWYTQFARIRMGIKTGIRVPSNRCHYSEVEALDMAGEHSPRVMNFDIETDDRQGFPDASNPESRILSIVAHDSVTGKTVAFLDLDDRSLEEAFDLDESPQGVDDLGVDYIDELKFRGSEKKMLTEFACWVSETDPDLITAWNVNFDMTYLVARMREIGVSAKRMTRHDGDVELNHFNDEIKRFGGRSVYDLLEAYKDTKRSELQSYRLNNVAQEELDDAKIEHQDMGFFEMYQKDTRKFLEYNAKDVDLAVRIDEECGVLAFKNALREEVGVDFEMTTQNNEFIEMFTRRKLHERGVHGPTKEYNGKDNYEGGHVFEPSNTVCENVTGIDVKSLYPMTMKMFNCSPETKLVNQPPPGFPANKAPNGIWFSRQEDGIFKELVDEAIDLKETYRDKANTAREQNNREMVAKWDERYAVAKTITNSIYGVLGWEQFFLYDKDVAEAVTLLGQACIKRSARFVEEDTEGEVIYGDTDSNYVKWPDEWSMDECIVAAKEVCQTLTESVYPQFANEEYDVPLEDCQWIIEPENFIKRWLQSGMKKRYAYLMYWDEGDDIRDDPEVKISGYGSKRSDFSLLTQETQKKVIKAILYGKDDSEIGRIVRQAADEIKPYMDDWERIGIPGGLGQKISREHAGNDDYYNWSTKGDHPQDAHPRAAWNANHILGTNTGEGSKPMRMYLDDVYSEEMDREIDVIGFESNEQIENHDKRFKIDAQRMTTTAVRKPMRDVMAAADIDVDAAIKGQLQSGLGAFM